MLVEVSSLGFFYFFSFGWLPIASLSIRVLQLFIQNRLEVAASCRAHGVLLGDSNLSAFKVRGFLGEVPAVVGGENNVYRSVLVGKVATNLEEVGDRFDNGLPHSQSPKGRGKGDRG